MEWKDEDVMEKVSTGCELSSICNLCEHLYALIHLIYMLLPCDTTNLLFRKWSLDAITFCRTRRVPVQRAVERDEIPYP